MRLSASLYWVASGYVGPWITHKGDCNVYLLRGPGGYVMIDAGGGQEPELIERQMSWDGVELNEIKAILLTHPHVDHAAGAPYWRSRCGAQVFAPAACSAYLRKGGPYNPEKPAHGNIPPCPVDVEMQDEGEYKAAGLRFRALAAPGHCPSMMMYLFGVDERNVLASGDSFYWGGKVTVFSLHDSDLSVFKATLLRLKQVEFEAMLPGHRYPVLNGAQEHLDLALEQVDRQLAGAPPLKG